MTDSTRRPNAFAGGLSAFAGAMMFAIGIFQILAGIVALADDSFYLSTRNYTFEIDITTWGWIHLLIGVALILVGIGVINGATWARITGVVVVGLSMLDNFLFVPYYPLWALLLIALNVTVIWALCQDTSRTRT